jgi:hypothetical protein
MDEVNVEFQIAGRRREANSKAAAGDAMGVVREVGVCIG